MSLTIELPQPLGEELASEAQQVGISAAERATLLLYLATALLKEENPTPFQETVRNFLAHRSLDAGRIRSVLEELVRVCVEAREEGATPSEVPRGDAVAYRDATRVRHWRDAIVHAIDGSPDIAISDHPPTEAIPQRTGRLQGRPDGGERATPHDGERDPELVARVKSIRGKFARSGDVLASEELHCERQSDKEKEEQQVWAPEP
jgi:hypothetical protein